MDLIEVLRSNSAYKLIKADIDQGVLSHSYMVIGDDAKVIDAFMNLVSLMVYCESNSACMNCIECKKVLNGNNANIYRVVPANGKDIKVDEISAMIEDTYIAPYDNGYKEYIIARGESMNIQAQNKLLKTLEEPVGKKLMLIGTTNESSMLDTIKSRCKKLYIAPFTLNEVKELVGDDATEEDIERAYKMSGGRYSVICSMLEEGSDLVSEYDKVVEMLKALTNSRELPRVVGMIEGKLNGERAKSFLDILEVVMRDTLRGANPSLAMIGFNPRTIANIEDLISKAREKLNFNCGAQAVIDYVLFGILEVKYKCR